MLRNEKKTIVQKIVPGTGTSAKFCKVLKKFAEIMYRKTLGNLPKLSLNFVSQSFSEILFAP
jgi:hypothetical protein